MPTQQLQDFTALSQSMIFTKDILILVDGSGTFNWTEVATGGDDVAAFAAAASYQTTNGIHIATRATNPAEDDHMQIIKVMPFPVSNLLKTRFKLQFPDISTVKLFDVLLSVKNGTRKYYAQFFIDPNTPEISYLDSAGSPQAITEFDATWTDGVNVQLEFNIDLVTLEYIDAQVQGIVKSLSGISYQNSAANTGRSVTVSFNVVAAGAAQAAAYINDILICGIDGV